ncbi:MAG: Stk1 family PASTA domain-containing Ser/Thr kinase [Propionibacteriales bacterium]|nr:Stk1 family PASTA domain-containing Ser/Thr kinase [Propionibacteriales bacterium]
MERTDHPGEGTGRADDPLIGRVLDGRYQVGEQIARGGMATVYRGQDLRLERTVAIKIMHAGLVDDPEFVARFEREARSAARLSHHNVVAVFDQGADRGTLFLVMEYVPGNTLRDVIRRDAPMDPGKALALIEPVLAALAAAHGAGIIHRDVKPENVLIAPDGRVKVADFGLARAVNADTQHTATGGVLIGTVSYLSPELVVDGKADARSDVYAAGVLIYEMLTGAKPHQADSPIQVAYKHVHEDIPAPSLRVPGLPAYVDALVARATARDRDLRPSDARVLLHQVRRVRQALDHGVVEDPELVADLLPSVRRDPDVERTGVIPRGADEPVVVDEVYNHQFDDDFTAPVDLNRPPVVPVVTGPRDTPRPIAAEPRPTGGVPPRRSRRGLYLLVAVLLAALVTGLGAWHLGRQATVPSVENLTVAQATAKLKKAGLKLREGSPEYSDQTADTIIRSSPKPGSSVTKGDTVTVILSLGPEISTVPRTRGKTLDEARALLEAAKFVVADVQNEVYDETVAAGEVVKSSPAGGLEKPVGEVITLFVSKGRAPITIPDFTNKLAKNAKAKLAELGFKVTSSEAFSDTVPVGRVISQTPSSGTGFKNDTVDLVVSKGVELIEVPDVLRKKLDDAREILVSLGFVVEVRRSGLYVGVDRVAGSDPDSGTRAPRGSTITLTVV